MVTFDPFEGSVGIHQASKKGMSERRGRRYYRCGETHEQGHGGLKDYGIDEKSKVAGM